MYNIKLSGDFMKVLIIEDEYNLADAISSMLENEKYIVDINLDGEEGLNNALSGVYDLIILDVMLPIMNGFQILREIRNKKLNVKVIMLTARTSLDDKMEGFDNGADDYLTKPFHMEELLARVNLQLKKQELIYNNDLIVFGDLKLDIKKLELICSNNEETINIVRKEFQILEMFLKQPNIILSKEQIFLKIWGYDSECEINNLEAYISFIRKKIKIIGSNVVIKAIRNMGYKLEVKE